MSSPAVRLSACIEKSYVTIIDRTLRRATRTLSSSALLLPLEPRWNGMSFHNHGQCTMDNVHKIAWTVPVGEALDLKLVEETRG
mgnify:CR=1 FL=1